MTDTIIATLLVFGVGLGTLCTAGAVILGIAAWRGEP